MILILNTVIDRVNQLGKYQQDILIFTHRKGRLIGDGDVRIKGVDGDENEAPLKFDNGNNLGYQEYQEELHPDQYDQTIQRLIKVKVEPLEEGPTIIAQVP